MRRGPPDMESTVRSFAVWVVLNRHGAKTTNADGFGVSSIVSRQRVLMHEHPATGEQLQRLPDGLEVSDVRQGYTPAVLSLGDESTGQRPDSVTIYGAEYEVVEVSPWAGGPAGTRTWRQCLLSRVRRT